VVAIVGCVYATYTTLLINKLSQACHLAEESIRDVLDTGDNVAVLLALHVPASESLVHDRECSSTRPIKTK
jgi:predicted nucleic acid-binding protein